MLITKYINNYYLKRFHYFNLRDYKPFNDINLSFHTNKLNSLTSRDIFVLDESFNYNEWIQNNINNSNIIKHPNSKHIISKYSQYIHEHSIYNFNNIGEYTFNMSPACELNTKSNDNSNNNIDNNISNKDNNSISNVCHSLLIWPDKLYITNLQQQHIKLICPIIMKDENIQITNIQNILDNNSIINTTNNTYNNIDTNNININLINTNNIIIILYLSPIFTYQHVINVKQWFQESFQKYSNNNNYNINYYITNNINNKTHALILPYEDRYEDIYSLNKINNIVKTYCDNNK